MWYTDFTFTFPLFLSFPLLFLLLNLVLFLSFRECGGLLNKSLNEEIQHVRRKGHKNEEGIVLWNFSSALFLNAMLLVLFLGLLVPYQILRSSQMFSSVKQDHIWTQRRNVKFGRRTTYGGHMDKCSCIIVEFAIIFPIHRLQFLGFIFEFFCFQLTVLQSSIVLKKKCRTPTYLLQPITSNTLWDTVLSQVINRSKCNQQKYRKSVCSVHCFPASRTFVL